MDRLWTPWRYQYVTRPSDAAAGESQSLRQPACIFCDKAAAKTDDDNLIVTRALHNFVLLNLFPYTAGHLMIAPYLHVDSLAAAPPAAAAELMELTRQAERALRAAYRSPGLNLGMNLGECAGAGVAGHIHMHVLPRWPGDANFMTTIGETRVLPEDLGTSLQRIRAAWPAA